MEKINDIQSAIDAGKGLGSGRLMAETSNQVHYIVPKGFDVKSLDNKEANPLRATGVRKFVSAKSFCSYVNKHKVADQTIIIADEKGVIKAVFNDNGDQPHWGDFGAELTLEKSRQWKAWTELAGDLFGQEEFAQLIEEHRSDFMSGVVEDGDGKEISNIRPNEFSQMILNLEQTVETKLVSKIDPTSGARNFSFSNDELGDGSFQMPKQMVIAIPVFKSGDLFQVVVSLRSRIENGTARFGFIIHGQDETIDKAFNKVCTRIFEGQSVEKDGEGTEEYEGTSVEVYKGTL